MTLHASIAQFATYDFARTDVNGERRGVRFFTRLALALGTDFRVWLRHPMFATVCETSHITIFRSLSPFSASTGLRERVEALVSCINNREKALANRDVLVDAYDAGILCGYDFVGMFANKMPVLNAHPVYNHQMKDGGVRLGILFFNTLLNDLGGDWRKWPEHPDFEGACATAHHCIFKRREHFSDCRGLTSGLVTLIKGPTHGDRVEQALYAHAFRDAFDAGILTIDEAFKMASKMDRNDARQDAEEEYSDDIGQRKRWRTPEEITQIVVSLMERAKAGEPSPKGKERMTVVQIARRMITQRIDQKIVRECHEAFLDAGWVEANELHPAI